MVDFFLLLYRVVRGKKLDGIVVFADDSNMHSMEFFDEIQKVKEIGAVSVGILAHSGNSDEEQVSVVPKRGVESKSSLPIQGPACNSSDQLVGWHTFDPLLYVEKSARYIGDKGIVLPMKMEWAGFVLSSRLLWEETENNPDWVKHLQKVVDGGPETYSPLSLLKDPAVVEPLGSCGRKVMLWWLRVEARADSKFPARLVFCRVLCCVLIILLYLCHQKNIKKNLYVCHLIIAYLTHRTNFNVEYRV